MNPETLERAWLAVRDGDPALEADLLQALEADANLRARWLELVHVDGLLQRLLPPATPQPTPQPPSSRPWAGWGLLLGIVALALIAIVILFRHIETEPQITTAPSLAHPPAEPQPAPFSILWRLEAAQGPRGLVESGAARADLDLIGDVTTWASWRENGVGLPGPGASLASPPELDSDLGAAWRAGTLVVSIEVDGAEVPEETTIPLLQWLDPVDGRVVATIALPGSAIPGQQWTTVTLRCHADSQLDLRVGDSPVQLIATGPPPSAGLRLVLGDPSPDQDHRWWIRLRHLRVSAGPPVSP